MPSLNLPLYTPKMMEKDGKKLIFDPLRQKYVALTPEEWVRQRFINYLITEKGYPQELMGSEIALTLNGTSRRCDTVVYDRYLTPLMVIEYKAAQVNITQAVFDQIARYNMVMQVSYLIVSNGLSHYCCVIDYKNNSYSFLKEIPTYSSITP
jgi:predicted type IV restriction endonuclease